MAEPSEGYYVAGIGGRAVTDTIPKTASGKNAEMEVYREQVSAAMKAANGPTPPPPAPPREVIFNRSAEHAAIIVEHLFLAAQEEVNIVTSRLDEKVYSSQTVIEAAMGFLHRNPTGRINVLIETDVDLDSHPWVKSLKNVDRNRVKLWHVPDDVSAHYKFNFAVSDRKHYRLEQDRKTFEAFAQFGNDKTGADLTAIFVDIQKLSKPIELN
jgi:hypothetical protein